MEALPTTPRTRSEPCVSAFCFLALERLAYAMIVNGQMIGVGTAGAVNAAKRIAAAQAIAWLNAAGYP